MASNLIDGNRVAVVSPFFNFNILLALNAVNELVNSSFGRAVVVTLYRIAPELIDKIIDAGENVTILNGFKCLDNFPIYAAVLDNINADSLIQCFINVEKVLVIAEKIRSLHRLKSGGWKVYRVKRVNTNTYSLLEVNGNGFILLKVEGYVINRLQIPDDVLLIYNEVVNRIKEFGSIRASDLLKYMVKKLGYDREYILNAIRKSIAMGIIKYQSGYLIPGMLITDDDDQ